MREISYVMVCDSKAERISRSVQDIFALTDSEEIIKDTLTSGIVTDQDTIKQLTGENYDLFLNRCETVSFSEIRGLNLMPLVTDIRDEFRIIKISIIGNDTFTSLDFTNSLKTDEAEDVFKDIADIYLQEADGVILVFDSVKEKADRI